MSVKLINTMPHPDPRCLYELRTARKRYRCHDTYGHFASGSAIKPGDQYVLVIELPGGESGYASDAGRPVTMRICINCADLGTRLQPLEKAATK